MTERTRAKGSSPYVEMKFFISSIVVTVLIAGVACSRRPQAIQIAGPSPSPSVDQRLKRSSEQQYEWTAKGITELAKQLRIANLKDGKSHSGTEFRLYHGLGLFFPRCFIYRSWDNKREALFIDAKVRNNKAVFDRAGHIQPETKALAAPVSGWESFEKRLDENGVAPTLNLKFDEYDIVDPDEGSIMLELRNGKNYSAVSYTSDNDSQDGKKAKRACELVEKEFGVKMGCG